MFRILNRTSQIPIIYSNACKLGAQCISTRYTADIPKETLPLWTSTSATIQGTLIPLSEQYFLQKVFFIYNYPIMHFMNTLVSVMPMWSVIMTTTLTYRLLSFPQTLAVHKIGIRSNNIMPETQRIQAKMNEALSSGNNYEFSIQKHKLDLLFKEHNLNLKARLKPHLLQVPGAACMFMILNGLSHAKVESMATGGVFWFTNLSSPDPLYILPLIASATTYLMMELNSPTRIMQPLARWTIRAIPFGLFLFMMNFPSSISLYWAVNNVITLLFLSSYKYPAVSKFLKIPNKILHDPSDLPLTKQTLQGQVKSAVEKSRRIKTTEDLRRIDDIAFRKAAIGPLKKTYKEDPTKNKVE